MAIAWLSGFGDEIDPSLDVQMDVLEGLGIGAIELRGVDGKNIAQYTPAEAKAVHRRMADRGFIASALGSPIGKSQVTDPFGPVLDTFRNLLEVAQALSCKGIRLFSFFIPAGEHAAYRDEVMTRMQALKEAAKGSGVKLLHENEGGIYGDIVSRNVDLAKALCDDDFALIYDPSNYVQQKEDAYVCWQQVKPYVRYLHMKDSIVRKAGDEDNPHRVVGDGEGRLREVLADIAATDFTGFFSIEPHLHGSKHVPGTDPEKWTAAAVGLKALLGEAGIAIQRPE